MSLFHAFLEFVAVADDSGLDHLAEQVVTLAGTLAHTGEDREAVVALGDVVDKFHDEDGLAHSGASEETDLAALDVGLEQVDDLDAGVEHLLGGSQVLELGRLAVYRQFLGTVQRAQAVNALSHDIQQAALDLVAHRHGYRASGRCHRQMPLESVGRLHRYCSHGVFSYVLLHFENLFFSVRSGCCHGLMNARKPAILSQIGKMDIYDRTYNLRDISCQLHTDY